MIQHLDRFNLNNTQNSVSGLLIIAVEILSKTRCPYHFGHTPVAVGRVMQAADNLPRSGPIVDFGTHDAFGSHVENPVNPLRFRTFDPNKGGSGRMFESLKLIKYVAFGTGPVFEVNQNPVETSLSHDFCRERTAQIEPASMESFALFQALFEIFHQFQLSSLQMFPPLTFARSVSE